MGNTLRTTETDIYQGFDNSDQKKYPSIDNKKWILQQVPKRFHLNKINNIKNIWLRKYYQKMFNITSELKESRHGEKAWWILRWSAFGSFTQDKPDLENEDIQTRQDFLQKYATSGNIKWFYDHNYLVNLCKSHPNKYLISFDHTIPGNINIYINKTSKNNPINIEITKININPKTFKNKDTLYKILPSDKFEIFNE
jgi:hypothetical protein